jgi:hypothetical protein
MVSVDQAPLALSWNDTVSARLPRIGMTPTTRRLISNSLFFIIVIQAVPSAILAARVYKTNEAGGLIPGAIALQLVVSSFWIAYGVTFQHFLLIASATLLFIANATLLTLVMRARSNE